MVFKEAVDNYVQATTKFKSAEELLKSGKPLIFVWICLGALALLGLVAMFPVGIVVGAFLGYVAAYLVGRVMFMKLTLKTYSVPSETDLDQLIGFLNENLQYLSAYFHEWTRVDDNTISCGFQNGKIHSVIKFDSTSTGKRFFTVSARKASVINYIMISPAGVSASKTNAGFGEYRCAYLSAPILSAAVEYYLKSETTQEAKSQ